MASVDEVIRKLSAAIDDADLMADAENTTYFDSLIAAARVAASALSAMQEENARLREEAASALRFLEYVSWGPRSPRSARDREEIQHDTIATRHGSYARVTEVIASLRRALSPNQAEP